MKSIAFPRMILNKTSSNIIDDRQATKNNIANLLGSEQGTLFGDPFYGIRLKFYMFEQNSKVLKDILIDEIYTQIKVNAKSGKTPVFSRDFTLLHRDENE